MCFLVVFLAVMPGIISSAPCLFVPDLNLNCVQPSPLRWRGDNKTFNTYCYINDIPELVVPIRISLIEGCC
jgi:hypothetical protein